MADDNVIQCPTCGKKFKLPARPPATFACTQCATVMDLSGFRTEEAAAPAATGAPSRAGGARSGGSGRTGGRTSGGAAAARARRARAQAAGDDDEEEGGGRGGLPPKKKSNAVIWGSFAGMVVVLFLALVLLNKKKVEEVSKKPPAGTGATASVEPETPPTPPAMAGSGTPAPAGPAGDATAGMGGTAAMDGEPAAMESAAGMEGETPPAPSGPYVNPSKLSFAALGHHPEASAEDKAQIDALIQKAVFENAGRDSRDAGHELVSKYGMKAAPRLVNVFATVSMGEGFGEIQGRMKCGVADGLLRRIDGYIERKKSPRVTPIKAQSDAKWVEKVARYWTAWWLNGEWQTPNKPWDERVDGNREDAADKPGGGPGPMGGGDTPDGGGDK